MHDEFQAVVDDLFTKIDINNDGRVSLDEFVETFHNQKREFIEQIETLDLRIKDQEQRKQAIEVKLYDLERTEKSTNNRHPVNTSWRIMKNSTLSVHIIDARQLRPGGARLSNAQVRLSIEDQSSNTQKVMNSNDPVWNEVIAFDIITGKEDLLLEVQDWVTDKQKKTIGSTKIDLKSLSAVSEANGEIVEIDQMKRDDLYELGDGQQIRVALQWIYSKVKLLKDI